MAKVASAYTSYAAVGNREDLSDLVSNLSPTSTPVIAAIGKRTVSNRSWSWQTEALASVDTNNAQQEGFVAVNQAPNVTALQTNTTQILSKNAVVAGTQEKITSAGRTSEMAHQLALRTKEAKRDLEAIICQNQAMVVGDDAGPTARKTRALEHFIQTNVSTGSGYAAPASPTAAMTDGTTRAFTETMLLDTMQLAWTNGGEPGLLVCGPTQRRKVSSFAGRSGIQVPMDKNQLVQSVTIYESDFGVLKVVPSRFVRARTVLLLDPEKARLAYLRPWKMEPLAKTGDADVTMITCEVGLQIDNELAHGKVADLS